MVSLEKAAGMGSIDDTAQCSTVTATSKNQNALQNAYEEAYKAVDLPQYRQPQYRANDQTVNQNKKSQRTQSSGSGKTTITRKSTIILEIPAIIVSVA